MKLTLTDQLIVGRTEGADAPLAGFDLANINGAELGVSRRHAQFINDGDHVSLTDLGSSNGTYINGMRLTADKPQRLNDGDNLRFGHLGATVVIRENLGTSSIQASRYDLNLDQAPKIGRGQKILIVEDDSSTSDLCQIVLKRAGYTVQGCRDVVSAIRHMNQAGTPALILLDLLLPSIHGLELCRYIRRDTKFPTVPVVIMSALVDKTSIQQAMDAGADIYISKPPNLKEMVKAIAALIRRSELEKASSQGTRRLETGTAELLGKGTGALFEPSQVLHKILLLFVQGHQEPITVVVNGTVTLGRLGGTGPLNNGSSAPHIDLEPYGAYDKGVSRVHARIMRADDGFYLEDLGSTNKTRIAGQALRPNEPTLLPHEAEISLGRLKMNVFWLIPPPQSETEQESSNSFSHN